jgi:hypothetical protein
MAAAPHLSPVNRLLIRGEDASVHAAEWADYRAFGIGPAHIPELIRMMTDEALQRAETESALVWAPLHAWRALGQFRAVEAIEPLLGLLRYIDDYDDDWIREDLPRVFSLIGPAAVAPLAAYLADQTHGEWARCAAADGLARIGRTWLDAREACVAGLTDQLGRYTAGSRNLNASCVAALVDLMAVESADAIRRAFAAGAVDLAVQGDWEEVQIQLGLLAERLTPSPERGWLFDGLGLPNPSDVFGGEDETAGDGPDAVPAEETPDYRRQLQTELQQAEARLAASRTDLERRLRERAKARDREKAEAKRKAAEKARKRSRRR